MGQEQHRATARVLDIVESLSEVQEGLTLAELAVALKAPKSSLFPIVHTLEQRKYIMCDAGSGKYRLGLRTYIIGASCTSQSGFEPLINIMNSVTESTQETSQFGILEGGNVLYVAKKDSPQAIRMISWVGTKLPANATAIGKALLSDLTDEQIRDLYRDGLPKLTEHTISDMDLLLGQIEQIRCGEIATETEESTPQMRCFAVPIRQNGRVDAALSISVPIFRYTDEKRVQICQCLREAQQQIEQLVGLYNFELIKP